MEEDFTIYEGVVVPESALLSQERKNLYGGVEGLDDEKLAEADEIGNMLTRAGGLVLLLLP